MPRCRILPPRFLHLGQSPVESTSSRRPGVPGRTLETRSPSHPVLQVGFRPKPWRLSLGGVSAAACLGLLAVLPPRPFFACSRGAHTRRWGCLYCGRVKILFFYLLHFLFGFAFLKTFFSLFLLRRAGAKKQLVSTQNTERPKSPNLQLG